MRSRAVRVTLTLVALVALAAAGYATWEVEAREAQRRSAQAQFDEVLRRASRDAQELRGAQQAYVAAGQSEGFWFSKVTSLSEELRGAVVRLDQTAPSPAVRAALAESTAGLDKFERVDRRARDYASTGQKLLASDIIFGDGLAAATATIAAFDQARMAASTADGVAQRAARRAQLSYLGGGLAAVLLVLLLLTPAGSAATAAQGQDAVTRAAEPGGLDLKLREEPPAPRTAVVPTPPASAATPPPATASSRPGAASVEIQAVAAVCTDLAKLADTDRLPAILERTARALDASGLVLWVSDFEGAELVPVATHGYPASVLSRLGSIPRESENVTAAAFRTGLVQVVPRSGSASGAIAAPLVTAEGCRGVLSAEVRRAESDPNTLAAAAIVAAQLSSLVGPPPASASQDRQAAL